ncbi:hypothetical protein RTBOTA2_001193 [Rhodotorula toruloides]|nr:hypothetical protein RTBOTA2_001193 [Rhodotorula toruloides]
MGSSSPKSSHGLAAPGWIFARIRDAVEPDEDRAPTHPRQPTLLTSIRQERSDFPHRLVGYDLTGCNTGIPPAQTAFYVYDGVTMDAAKA